MQRERLDESCWEWVQQIDTTFLYNQTIKETDNEGSLETNIDINERKFWPTWVCTYSSNNIVR